MSSRYLEVSVAEGGGKDIHCPGHDCSRPVPIVSYILILYYLTPPTDHTRRTLLPSLYQKSSSENILN